MKITSIIIFIALVCTLSSCNKGANFNYPPGTVGISKIVYFPTITLKGNVFMSVVEGGAFTDPGSSASAGGDSLPVTVSGSVNTQAVGIYILTYSALNAQGFPASQTRTVAVLPTADAGIDISGTYYYVAASGTTATVTELAPGFFATSNCWSPTSIIPVEFICVDGANIIIPNQTTPYGPSSGAGTLSASGALTFVVNLPAYGISNASRDWQKQ